MFQKVEGLTVIDGGRLMRDVKDVGYARLRIPLTKDLGVREKLSQCLDIQPRRIQAIDGMLEGSNDI